MSKLKKWCATGLCAALLMGGLSACADRPSLPGTSDKVNPVAITIWHYYNGAQQKAFDQLVGEFNDTVGLERGIVVESHGYGSVNELSGKVLDAIYEKVGAEEVPDIFAAYADTAYEINGLGKLADLSQYLSAVEQDAYITGYMEEGRFEENGGIKLFPIAKSTEVLTLNKTEWDAFVADGGGGEADLATWEGVASLAEQYYNWTDERTPDVVDDGKAFFGRDAFANYIIIGSRQLGTALFAVTDGKVELNIDNTSLRRLWDNYYVPYINGYFNALGKFRSDDVRTGDLCACVGSTSAATFFPTEVTRPDGSTYPIEVAVYPLPNFAGTEPMAVQQGASMAVSKSTPERETAAVEFLKWFTQPEQNAHFATSSGYLPVTHEANRGTGMMRNKAKSDISSVLDDTLAVGMEMSGSYELYTNKAFNKGGDARKIVESSMRDKSAADRAAILELMAAGTSRADAVAQYDNDDNFNAWAEEFRTALNAVVAE